MSNEIKVAIAQEALSCFARVPQKVQKKVSEFLSKFMSNPELPGINYESIRTAADRNLRSVRFGDDYRGIILKPEQGVVYVLLWIDRHDEAYDWAARHRCRVHPDTGALQVLSTEYKVEEVSPAVETKEAGLFDAFSDRDLGRIGLPEELLPVVRSLQTEEDLDRAAAQIPEEVCDPLYQLAAGYSLQEVLAELEAGTGDGAGVDVDDFAAALERMNSQRRFVVVESELELQAMLNAPMEKWRVFLHPAQRKLVERSWSGPVSVLGGAGTGKTVAAMHRARWLVARIFPERGDRILFTTFTRNLAEDIRGNLRRICSVEQMGRIEVVHMDKWVSDFIKEQKFGWQIAWNEAQKREFWQSALIEDGTGGKMDARFYREEWEQVVLPQGIANREEYLLADRRGRKGRLNRAGRAAVWPVFDAYRRQLQEKGLREEEDALREVRQYIQGKAMVFPYRAILVDEAQDMGTQVFLLLRAIAGEPRPNDLFLVGDAHQRIYGKKVVYGRCGIDVVGRSRKLRINYRTTEEIRRKAVGILDNLPVDNLDGGADDVKAYKSLVHGAAPEFRSCKSFEKECDFLAGYLLDEKRKANGVTSVCVVLRTNDLVDHYKEALEKRGVHPVLLKRDFSEDMSHDGIGMATMHRVKGLEFDAIVLAGAGKKNLRIPGSESEDPELHEDSSITERSLLYVALTRARKEVLVTWHGDPSPLLLQG